MSNLAIGPKLQTLFGQAALNTSNPYSRHIFSQLHHCHTPAMGMHFYKCNETTCNHMHQQYHSCGNRHCPNCGGLKKEQWIENLTAQLFPTAYYHVVFTIPHEFNALILGNRKAMFNLLFEAGSATLLQFASDPQYLGAACGITAVLHTWGQQLVFHPHLHCIVSGGGIKNNQWVHPKRRTKNFLFPVPAMPVVYKGIFLKKLRLLLAKGLLQTEGLDLQKLIKKAGFKKWNIYAKAPFGTVSSVVEYIGRYSHKVAITKHRILAITDHSVTFKYKDYHDGCKQKQSTLSIAEFMSRFALHFLPRRYVKIRHYGFLQNHGKTKRLNGARAAMQLQPLPPKITIPVAQRMLEQYGKDISQCPKCEKGKLQLIAIIYPGIQSENLLPAIIIAKTDPNIKDRASPNKS